MNRCLIFGDCDPLMLHCNNKKSIKRKKEWKWIFQTMSFTSVLTDLLKIQKGPNSVFVFLIFLI